MLLIFTPNIKLNLIFKESKHDFFILSLIEKEKYKM